MKSLQNLTVAVALAALGPAALAQEDAEPWVDDSTAETADTEASGEEAVADPEPEPEPAAKILDELEEPSSPKKLNLAGYVQPQFDFRYRPEAFPRDRTTYGAQATRVGVILSGEPLSKWTYNVHVVASSGLLNVVTDVESVDQNGDGQADVVSANTESAPGLFIERATISVEPMPKLRIDLGQMRIPFTAQAQSPNTALMFPNRSGPNEVFLSGTDLGGLVSYDYGIGSASVGVFNGTGANNVGSDERGLLYSGRVDLQPLGNFPFTEGGHHASPLRIGVGAGVLYFPSRRFANSGFEGTRARDLRASLSFRLAIKGFHFQAEALRRQQTDSLSSRPLIATGAYGQASQYLAIRPGKLGVSPIARFGLTVEDQSFDPRTSIFAEAGAALFIHRGDEDKDTIKLIVEYLSELRLTEGENAHGAVAQLQLQF
jgi:hypothetical protein